MVTYGVRHCHNAESERVGVVSNNGHYHEFGTGAYDALVLMAEQAALASSGAISSADGCVPTRVPTGLFANAVAVFDTIPIANSPTVLHVFTHHEGVDYVGRHDPIGGGATYTPSDTGSYAVSCVRP